MKNKNLEILMVGTIMGIFLGVMFAPKSGKRTREDIMDMMNDMKKMDCDDIKECFDSKIKEIEDELKDFDKEKVLKTAKKKAECMLQKADELVEEAMEKENEMFFYNPIKKTNLSLR